MKKNWAVVFVVIATLIACTGVMYAQDKTEVLSPITMTVDTAQYARTKGTGQAEITSIRSTNPAVATAREWGTNEIQINGKRPGQTTIRFYDRSTRTQYVVNVTVTARHGEPTPPPVPPKPPEKKKEEVKEKKPAENAAKKELDPCLVGSWRSESYALMGSEKQNGGADIVMTIKNDRSIKIDYDGSQPRTDNFGTVNTWVGSATGFISTDKGTATVVDDTSNIVRKFKDPRGVQTSSKLSGLGPASPGKPPDRTYTCDATTLKYQTFALTFTFKRQK